ncbi:alpha/beta fold hydrolase [Curtobacterium ammoniigenes]|uniref:alpha/beta fold hydrolase n=1 Tax=Curtobacterium ammoniigenes TaxID=395387 RepID=UPI000832D31A|nr:alpha/beta fold hydrolase [Curtobacterium ammoniigenes]
MPLEAVEHTLDLDTASLSYDVIDGDGPAIVGLHGLTSSRASEDDGGYFDWRPIAQSGRRLVRYDARGHGRSTGRPLAEDYRWPQLADDLFRLLDAVAPAHAVDAFGVSMGVGTLLHAAVREPERFRRLAFVIPPTAWESRAAQAALYQQMADLAESGGMDALIAAGANAPVLPILQDGGWRLDLRPAISAALFPAVARGAAATDFPDPTELARITHPVLVRPWTDDPGHPIQTAERLHELLPAAVLSVMRTPDDLRGLGASLLTFFS